MRQSEFVTMRAQCMVLTQRFSSLEGRFVLSSQRIARRLKNLLRRTLFSGPHERTHVVARVLPSAGVIKIGRLFYFENCSNILKLREINSNYNAIWYYFYDRFCIP